MNHISVVPHGDADSLIRRVQHHPDLAIEWYRALQRISSRTMAIKCGDSKMVLQDAIDAIGRDADEMIDQARKGVGQ